MGISTRLIEELKYQNYACQYGQQYHLTDFEGLGFLSHGYISFGDFHPVLPSHPGTARKIYDHLPVREKPVTESCHRNRK